MLMSFIYKNEGKKKKRKETASLAQAVGESGGPGGTEWVSKLGLEWLSTAMAISEKPLRLSFFPASGRSLHSGVL